jgi:carboxypeptidase Q
MRLIPALALALCLVGVPAAQSVQERIDHATIQQIRDEGLTRSQVMDHISWLADVYGPRLTGGPGIRQASDWAMKTFTEWGLANPHREHFPFGRGWSLERFHAQMIEPQVQPIIGVPGGWTPGTNGTITADVVHVRIDSEADFERYRGKLAGRIVVMQPVREVRMLEGTIVSRMGEKEIAEAMTTPIPAARGGGGRGGRGGRGGGRGGGPSLANRVQEFLRAEKVAAVFNRGSDSLESSVGSNLSIMQQRTDGGTVFPSGGGSRTSDPANVLPTVTLAVEHYNRMIRILDKGIPVKVELNIQTKFYEEPSTSSGQGPEQGLGFNTIAEIPGTDPKLKDEVVLLGAHLDSVAASTGATDNATGSAAVMEAMRILKAIGVQPRRTIRVALWGGEEQGLLGARAYVREHLGDQATMTLKPGHEKLAVYFNSDNGTGRIRGVWMQGNIAARPIFERWIEPLRDLGVEALAPRSVSSTDHVPFDGIGVPAFQFMVDRLEYNSRSHHSNMDFYDRVQRDDMVQHATVIAVFAYNAAMRDEKLPRKALPRAMQGRGTQQTGVSR